MGAVLLPPGPGKAPPPPVSSLIPPEKAEEGDCWRHLRTRPIYPRTVHCAVTVSRMNQVRPTPQAEGAYQFLSSVPLRAVPRTGRPRCRLTHSRSLCKGPGRERRTAPQQRGAGGCLSRPWQPDPKTAGWHLCPSGPSLSLVTVQDSSRGTKNRPGQW